MWYLHKPFFMEGRANFVLLDQLLTFQLIKLVKERIYKSNIEILRRYKSFLGCSIPKIETIYFFHFAYFFYIFYLRFFSYSSFPIFISSFCCFYSRFLTSKTCLKSFFFISFYIKVQNLSLVWGRKKPHIYQDVYWTFSL